MSFLVRYYLVYLQHFASVRHVTDVNERWFSNENNRQFKVNSKAHFVKCILKYRNVALSHSSLMLTRGNCLPLKLKVSSHWRRYSNLCRNLRNIYTTTSNKHDEGSLETILKVWPGTQPAFQLWWCRVTCSSKPANQDYDKIKNIKKPSLIRSTYWY